MRRNTYLFGLCVLLAPIPLILGMGCMGNGTPPPGPIGSTADGNVGVDPSAFPGQHVANEPDDTFDQAILVLWDSLGHGALQGTISGPDDVDVYNLGQLNAGDRIIVDVGTGGNGLDSEAAIFDQNQNIAFINDDRNLALNQLDPLINDVARYTSNYYLALANSPASTSILTGTYDINLTVVRGGPVPPPVAQTVVLNFGGGSITIPGDQTYTVGPFNTGEIAPVYAGMTFAVEQQIAATMQNDYLGLNLTIVVSPPTPLPTGCTASTILFGGFNPQAFGTSQDVDPYNQNHCDESIIFTDMFTPHIFGRVLTATELGEAIGNVAAHEMGHLLGLNHVDNTTDIMDTTGGPDTFFDQRFTTSPLDATIFPFGQQDGILLLLETLGGTRPDTP